MNNRKCIICQKEYKYCPSCAEHKNLPAWRILFHSEQCLNIYKIIVEFREGRMQAVEAAKELKALGMSNYDNYSEDIKTIINKIFEENNAKDEKQNRKIVKKTQEEVQELIETLVEKETIIEEKAEVEEITKEEIKEETVEADEALTMKYIPKQRRKK